MYDLLLHLTLEIRVKKVLFSDQFELFKFWLPAHPDSFFSFTLFDLPHQHIITG